MLIELWRKTVATSYSTTCCAICGNDFELGTVYPVAVGDQGQGLGEMCPMCLDYLNRRKNDPEDHGRGYGNWPARDWPTLEDLEKARRKHTTALFETDAELFAASGSLEAEDEIYRQGVIWRMEPETITRRLAESWLRRDPEKEEEYMTEQAVPEPTAFGAVVMDIALERGFGDPENLELREDLHKALADEMVGVRSDDVQDLALGLAFALGMDPDDLGIKQDARDLMRLAMAFTFGDKLSQKAMS